MQSTTHFKGINLYNTTAYVQEHTLINRGITTLGGSTVPQCLMSNNKHEATERGIMGGVYFVASYLTPVLLIPQYNKHFLKNKGIIKSVKGEGKKIIQVSKKYLTQEADLKKGLDETARMFDEKKGNTDCKKAFDEIYERYNNPDNLKKDLLSVHEKVLTTDFITTAGMWSAIPWIATEYTERKTRRKDFSAGFDLKKDVSKPEKEYKKDKDKKILWNVLFSVVPGLIFGRVVTKGISSKLNTKGNFIKKGCNKVLSRIRKNAENFDYASGTNMSKTIYASIWMSSSFPAKIISSRDKNERKDRALRDIGLFSMFFGGDFLINNIAGRASDRFLGTKIMDDKGKKLNFIERFKMPVRNFRTLERTADISSDVLKRTKTVGAGLYWFALLTNTALIGFALPKVLNKFLRHNIDKENRAEKIKNQDKSINFNYFKRK